MPRGGHARSGPAPDPNALRRERDNGEWVDLPAEGREGETPPWPLSGRTLKRERELWAELWTMPQAFMWERRRQFGEVALYVRKFVEAEKPGSPANLGNLVVRMGEGLGLTTPGLRANRWRIVADEVGQQRTQPQPQPSARDRLTVVAGDGDA